MGSRLQDLIGFDKITFLAPRPHWYVLKKLKMVVASGRVDCWRASGPVDTSNVLDFLHKVVPKR